MADAFSLPPGLPRDARAVVLILESMGVKDYEPRVVTQLLEFSHQYVADVLVDARAYSDHAGKGVVDAEDVKLAVQSRVNVAFTQPPPRELLMEIARVRNCVPLPPIDTMAGIPLPPDADCLTEPNFQWATKSGREALARAQRLKRASATKRKQAQAEKDGIEREGEAEEGTRGPTRENTHAEPTAIPTDQRERVSMTLMQRR